MEAELTDVRNPLYVNGIIDVREISSLFRAATNVNFDRITFMRLVLGREDMQQAPKEDVTRLLTYLDFTPDEVRQLLPPQVVTQADRTAVATQQAQAREASRQDQEKEEGRKRKAALKQQDLQNKLGTLGTYIGRLEGYIRHAETQVRIASDTTRQMWHTKLDWYRARLDKARAERAYVVAQQEAQPVARINELNEEFKRLSDVASKKGGVAKQADEQWRLSPPAATAPPPPAPAAAQPVRYGALPPASELLKKYGALGQEMSTLKVRLAWVANSIQRIKATPPTELTRRQLAVHELTKQHDTANLQFVEAQINIAKATVHNQNALLEQEQTKIPALRTRMEATQAELRQAEAALDRYVREVASVWASQFAHYRSLRDDANKRAALGEATPLGKRTKLVQLELALHKASAQYYNTHMELTRVRMRMERAEAANLLEEEHKREKELLEQVQQKQKEYEAVDATLCQFKNELTQAWAQAGTLKKRGALEQELETWKERKLRAERRMQQIKTTPPTELTRRQLAVQELAHQHHTTNIQLVEAHLEATGNQHEPLRIRVEATQAELKQAEDELDRYVRETVEARQALEPATTRVIQDSILKLNQQMTDVITYATREKSHMQRIQVIPPDRQSTLQRLQLQVYKASIHYHELNVRVIQERIYGLKAVGPSPQEAALRVQMDNAYSAYTQAVKARDEALAPAPEPATASMSDLVAALDMITDERTHQAPRPRGTAATRPATAQAPTRSPRLNTAPRV